MLLGKILTNEMANFLNFYSLLLQTIRLMNELCPSAINSLATSSSIKYYADV